MSDNSGLAIKGDRALCSGEEDKLAFRDVAKQIATSINDRAIEDGMVIGLEGSWGSGKSSLLFLINEQLESITQDKRPVVISFRPWLIGNRDALIYSLFDDLSQKIKEIEQRLGKTTNISVEKAREASEALRSFVNRLSKSGAVIKFAGKASGIGLIEMLGEGIEASGETAEGKAENPSLTDLKEKLARSLRDLGHRFVITIDDVDRLEPAEVIEILRLVRSVADLPNIVYILCYDSKILSHSIEVATGVKGGHAYLEKIVQMTVMVPQPEPFQLRQWFSEELHKIASANSEDERSRLEAIIDYEGGRQLRTPRSVIRALDALRFFWPPLSRLQADLADLVWIQLIKDGNPNLYRWIEDYCSTSSMISLGLARIDVEDREVRLADLLAAVDKNHFNDKSYRHYFADQLPGVEVDFSNNGKKIKIFCNVEEQDRDRAIRDRRLASPDHYRIYFALTNPSHALKQEEFSSIWDAAAADVQSTSKALLSLYAATASGTLTKADLLLERIRGGAYDILSTVQCENLLIAFSNVMDRAYQNRQFDFSWVNTPWVRARRLIPLLLSRLDVSRKEAVINTFFEKGEAIGWLTEILRRETFAHGRFGDRDRPEGEWIFTDKQLDNICEIMLNRYNKMSIYDIFSAPGPINLLFTWRQMGDEEGPRRLIESNIASDQGLLDTLDGLTSTVRSSDHGVYGALKRDNVGPFLNFDEARKKVDELTSHPDFSERAQKIAQRFKEGDHL